MHYEYCTRPAYGDEEDKQTNINEFIDLVTISRLNYKRKESETAKNYPERLHELELRMCKIPIEPDE